MVLDEEASATIAQRIGMYKPVAKPDIITHGTRSFRFLAKEYIRGGNTAINVPRACSLRLPYLSDSSPLGICIAAATALDMEKTKPSSVMDAPSESVMKIGQIGVINSMAREFTRKIAETMRISLP